MECNIELFNEPVELSFTAEDCVGEEDGAFGRKRARRSALQNAARIGKVDTKRDNP